MQLRNFVELSFASLLLLPAAWPQTTATPVAASAPTPVPSLVPYSGAAIANDGQPLRGETGVTFQIYKDEAGGEALWAESQSVALDPAGHYKVQLGATTPNGLPSDLFATGEARWLEVQIAGQSPQPRVLIASVPYALKAGDATTLGGLPASAYARASKPNAAPAISAAVTPAAVMNVTTTGGTAGHLPEFSGEATIVDSPVFVLGADVGIGTATPTATLDVDGTALITGALSTDSSAAFGGIVTVEAAGKATASAGASSHSLAVAASAYNSGVSEAVPQTFALKAVPVGNDTATASASLEVLFGQGTATPAETGLAIGANGRITFASGQTFPGTGPGTITGVTAGTDLTGGGTSGAVTLNLNTTATDSRYARLAAANSFTGNQTVAGAVTATSFSGSGAALTGVNAAEFGGLTPPAFAELAASNTFSATQSFSKIGIGTTTPRSLLEGQATASKALGPVFTLTNTAGGLGAGSALDFNTVVPATSGTYNPMARITAQDADHFSDNLLFQSNVPGAQNSGLRTNMIITSAGLVGIGTTTPISLLAASASAPGAVGPVFTLTNNGGNTSTANGQSAIDFNTSAPTTTGTYNPGARIVAEDDDNNSADLFFQVNNPGAPNNGLVTLLSLYSNGQVNTGPLAAQALSTVASQPGISGYSGNTTTVASGPGVYGYGGYSTESNSGDGGDFDGGYLVTTGLSAGDGIYAIGGFCACSYDGEIGLAANLDGDVSVSGTLTAASKDFKIDDPVDPANKYLYHASVESSEMMNIYTGNVVTDELGLATVKLPGWFEAENTDFRYQLTVIGGRFAQAIVSKEIANGQFTISTNASNVKVSWQITAVRQDAYAKAHPLVAEQEKPVRERGFYQNPELYGQPAEKQTNWGRHPDQMRRMKATREQQLKAQHPTGPALSHHQPLSAVSGQFVAASNSEPTAEVKP